jgi:hypothetical protein
MPTYEQRKNARIERLKARAAKKHDIAESNSINNLAGEINTGIPMGQPILIGHHSERRHRNHLVRIDKKIKKGFEAHNEAKDLERRAEAAENSTAIAVDNPEAVALIDAKIARLEHKREQSKRLNILVRKHPDGRQLEQAIALEFPELKNPADLAAKLLKPDFAGRVGVPPFVLTNLGAEIRRLKQKREQVAKVQVGFEPFMINDILVEVVDGQIQVEFKFKPNEETRNRLKTAPLSLKWSTVSKRWVRKHTTSTMGQWFQTELRKVLSEAQA